MPSLVYTPTAWVNGGAPGISAENLINIEDGIVQLTDAFNTQAVREDRAFAFVGQPFASTVDGDNGFFTVTIPSGSVKLVGAIATGIGGSSLTWKLRRYTFASGVWGDITNFGTTASPKSDSAVVSGQSVTLGDKDRISLWVVSAGLNYASFELAVQLDRVS